MRCPQQLDLQAYLDGGDLRVERHLASCVACREEIRQLQQLHASLTQMPALDTSATVSHRFNLLTAEIADQQVTCADTLTSLEAWREGALDPIHSFLVEDHLLSCKACAAALAGADVVTSVLRMLPTLEAPAVISERIERARMPWWQRLLPTPAPSSWPRLGWAMGAIAVALTMISALSNKPGVVLADRPTIKNSTVPQINIKQQPSGMEDPAETGPSVIMPGGTGAVVTNVTPSPRTYVITHDGKTGTSATNHDANPPHPSGSTGGGDNPYMRPNTDDRANVSNNTVDTTEYHYEAHDALLNRARDEERASIEETLSTVPRELVAAVPRNLPPAPRRTQEKVENTITPTPNDTSVSDAAIRAATAASIRESLSSKNGAPRTLSVRNERKETRTAGALGVTSF